MDEVTLGEVNRSVKRLELAVADLAGRMTVALGPVGEVKARVEVCERDVNQLWSNARDLDAKIDKDLKETKGELLKEIRENKDKTDKIELRAATAAGVIMAVGFFVKFIFKL